jgi:hypothetical protein
MKRSLSTVLAGWFLVMIPFAVYADSRTYIPPKATGYIYIVIDYKLSSLGLPQRTQASVAWGAYNRSSSISPPIGSFSIPQGFVIRLWHSKADSIPLNVSTDGRIRSCAQGSPPPQWGANGYRTYSW